MNFQFAIIFGYDYEGEIAKSLQLFESVDQIDDIIEQEMNEWLGLNYYMIGEIQSNGKINFSDRVDI